jgi:hypothetical protein
MIASGGELHERTFGIPRAGRGAGYPVQAYAIVQGDGLKAAKFLLIIHTVFGNMNAWLIGPHHGVSAKHLPRYLREWAYRFNRRNRAVVMGEFLLHKSSLRSNIFYHLLQQDR